MDICTISTDAQAEVSPLAKPRPLGWTTFHDEFGSKGTRHVGSWANMLEMLEQPRVSLSKSGMPGWSPAYFAGNRRCSDNVLCVSAVILDYDASEGATESVSIVEAFPGLTLALHSTYSSSVEVPRYRVVFPLSRPVLADEYTRCWSKLMLVAERAGHRPGRVEHDACRFWFQPAVHPSRVDSFEFRTESGRLLNVDDAIAEWDAYACGRQPLPKLPTSRVISDTLNSEVQYEHLQHHASDDPRAVKRAKALLEKIPGGVSGARGSMPAWDAAQVLVRGFCFADELAFSIFSSEYNPKCSPQWSEKEIWHKIRQARTRSGKAWGYLLSAPLIRRHKFESEAP